MTSYFRVIVVLLFLSFVACPENGDDPDSAFDADQPPDGDGDLDGDADSDGDVDSDVDGDSDADGDADPDTARHIVELPAQLPVGAPFPIIVRTEDGSPISETLTIRLGDQDLPDVRLYRGRGSTSAIIDEPGELALYVGDAPTPLRTLTAGERPLRVVQGELSGDDLLWSEDEDIHVTETIVVPEGSSLEIEAGVRVFTAPAQNIVAHGSIRVRGTEERPVLFTRAEEDSWGAFRFLDGSEGTLEHALLTGSGGDTSRTFGHSRSQPVVYVRRAECTVEGGGAIDNQGKGYSTNNGRLTIRNVVVSRCDTGGEHHRSLVVYEDSHVLEMPDADGLLDDDDNDGVYFDGPYVVGDETLASVVRNNVFALGEDDAIDQNGALVVVEGCWMEGFAHEGIAASNSNGVTVRDSVIIDSGQGIEAGYGRPEVVVEHCLLSGNGIGLRFGDTYDTTSNGHLTVRNTVVLDSVEHNVFNFVGSLDGPRSGAIDISCSMANDPEWNETGRNIAGSATWDERGCVDPSATLSPECDSEQLGPRTCD